MAGSVVVGSCNQMDSKRYWCDKNYMLLVAQSIKELVAQIKHGSLNLNRFVGLFYELMQSRIDSPLECIWTYSALKFRCSNTLATNAVDHFEVLKNSFHLLSSCSAACSTHKSVALLCPIVYQLFRIVKDLIADSDLGSNRSQKVCREVKSFIQKILGYASLCFCNDLGTEIDGSTIEIPLLDLVSLWMFEEDASLKLFFPMIGAKMCSEIENKCFDQEHFSGIVIAELFLLKLCMDISGGSRGPQLEKDLKTWAVASISGFQSVNVFDVLMTILMELNLPLACPLKSDDEQFLRVLLYDVVLLVDYSFLFGERTSHMQSNLAAKLLLKRLILICESTEFYRKHGDHKKIVSYNASFSTSKFYLHMIKLISTQFGLDDESNQLKDSSPRAILKWLVELEDHSEQIFGDDDLKLLALKHAKTASDIPETPISGPDFNIFYIDNLGEAEQEDKAQDDDMSNSMSSNFVAAAQSIYLAKGQKKRKANASNTKTKRSKLIKSDDEDEISLPEVDNSSSSESEVNDPSTDEE